ncbi:Hypothetical protein HVR_LOCUS250 [uncultured virus]|nr:Hypothetical protein HVR_LOCUS250 [uncultured virus]
MANTKITLMGDSVLDNFYWLSIMRHDLKYELEQLGYKVDNFAVDESQLNNVIHGIAPRDVYQITRHYSYPCAEDGKVHPIELLVNSGSNICVLSIGGNDLRVNLWKLTLGTDHFVNSVLTQQFSDNLDHVLTNIKLVTSKIILILVYIPYIGPGSRYAMFSQYRYQVSEKLLLFYRMTARKHNIPLLDLSKTFDYNDRNHYGSTEIEPSNLSNKCIADCINYIYRNYRGYSVYYAPNCNSDNIQVDSIYLDSEACNLMQSGYNQDLQSQSSPNTITSIPVKCIIQ